MSSGPGGSGCIKLMKLLLLVGRVETELPVF